MKLYNAGIIAVGDKANILTVRLARVDKALLDRNGTDFGFSQLSQRKTDMRKLVLSQHVKHIALILSDVRTAKQLILSTLITYAGVMSCCNRVTAEYSSASEQLVEFYIAVTVYAGIERDDAHITVGKALYYLPTEVR